MESFEDTQGKAKAGFLRLVSSRWIVFWQSSLSVRKLYWIIIMLIVVVTSATVAPQLFISRRLSQGCQYTDEQFLQLVILNERPSDMAHVPLLGLIHSLLSYTSRPIRFTIATNQPKEKHFLYQILHDKSPAIQVSIQSTKHLQKLAQQLVDRVQFKTEHHAGIIPMKKLFLPMLEYPRGTKKVLMLDEDFIFYRDIAPLYALIQEDPHKLDLYCPIDPILVRAILTSSHRNDDGHTERYCNSGIMGLPVTPRTSQLFAWNAESMTAQYPGEIYQMAEQDIVNRLIGPKGNLSEVNFLPCGWACDAVSCRKAPRSKTVMNQVCRSCPGAPLKQACHGFHFVNGLYKVKLTGGLNQPEDQWLHYYNQSTEKLLYDVFEPRVAQTMCPT